MLSKEASLEVALCKQQKQKVAVLQGEKRLGEIQLFDIFLRDL